MTKKALPLLLLLAVLAPSIDILARDKPAKPFTRAAELRDKAQQLKQRFVQRRRQARDWANRKGVPFRRELPDGKVMELQRVQPGTGPVFYITNNVDAADTVSTDEVWPGGAAGLALEGSGITVGEWDGGAVLATHPDLYPRVNQVDGATAVSNHATHVAGTLIGAGVAQRPEARGMAPAAMLDAYDWNSDTAEMAAAAAGGLLLSNHSYGIAAGWIYTGGIGPDEWWWIGGNGNEDPNFGYYDSAAQQWDQIAYDAPYYLIVKAAGNDRWDTGPGPGQAYTVVNQDGIFQNYTSQPRPPDCSPGGYDCLPTVSVAKNILTVGAVDDVIGGYLPLAGPASVAMTAFSGWGPTDDGRIKPDIVGNGWLLMSTYGEDPYYAASIGTSMAAPNVAGSLLLLQEHYQNLHGSGNFMRADTLKALAIHTADETGAADGPDYEYGWGLLNTESAAAVITDDYYGGGSHQIIEGSLANGATDSVQLVVVDTEAVVTATLVWIDPPGTPTPLSLDAPDSMLVNDLNLRISNGGPDYLPWTLDPAFPAAPATTGNNARDNVEQVEVRGGGAGTYTIRVNHTGTLLDGAVQHYALIISLGSPPPVSSGFLLDEDFSGGLPAGWSVLTDKGKSWTIRAPLTGDARYDNLTGGSGNFAMVDNQLADTSTSLVTPALDLQAASAAVLSFNSFFSYDFLESVNVDVSTDGGVGWSNVWQQSGFSNIPQRPVLDLSGSIAGHSDVRLRFRFESGWLGPDGDFWQIDDIKLEQFGGPGSPGPAPELPGQAANPDPANGAGNIGLDAVLSWSAGQLALSHDVYLSSDNTIDAGDFQGRQGGTSFDPGGLAYDTTYYWRVDEVNEDGATQGITWSFTTEPEPLHLIQPDVPDTGQYGNGFGTDEHATEFLTTFQSTGTDLVLAVTGFDVDWPDEIAVYLNGAPLGFLSPGAENGLNAGDSFAIPAAAQLPGVNEILFVETTPGWKWGVTDLLLTEGQVAPEQPDVTLLPGTLESGAFGHNYGSNQHDRLLVATFDATGTDLVLSVTGFDVDYADEITVYLNGAPLGNLRVGPDNGLNGRDMFAIPAELQLPGANEILFFEKKAGWTWGVTDLLLSEGVITGEAGDVVLSPDVPETGRYGNKYGTNSHATEFRATFLSSTSDLVLSVTGFDIDYADEIAVYLNGAPLGFLSPGADNGPNAGDSFAIPADAQLPGTNEILFVETTPGWKWGVTDLLLTEGVVVPGQADITLLPGTLESGAFGHNYGSNQHERQLVATFDATGTDLVLTVTGFDIDHAEEITVYLNGAPLGNLRVGPDNDLNGRDMFAIPAGLQLPGANEILFLQKTAGWTWGITDLLLSEGLVTGDPGDVVLSPDVPETGRYGNEYGTNSHPAEFRAMFLSSTSDLVLSVTGFDIDWPDEIAVYLNGAPLGFLSPGEDNGPNAGDSFAIPADAQLPGTNEILFVETTPGWTWGVTDLLLTEGVVAPEQADITLLPGTLESGAFGHNYGSNQHEQQLVATFDATGTDLVLTVTGFDIDYADEITVYLNGAPLGNLRVGPDNGLNGRDMFAIPAELQLPGANEILFFEKTAGWAWGVTDLLLSEGVVTGEAGDVVLSPDVPETGRYGNKYGTDSHATEFRATFLSSTSDLVLSVTGFDIDYADEIAVYLNGAPLGFLSPGANNGPNAGDSFAIPADAQLPGTNEILFVETTPGWKWGVTDLLLTVGDP